MKTIKQNVEVDFNAIDVKDVVEMLPLMDELKRTIAFEQATKIKDDLPKEEQKCYNNIYYDTLYLDLITKINIYNLLTNCANLSELLFLVHRGNTARTTGHSIILSYLQ